MRNVNTPSLRLDYVSCNLANIRPWLPNQNSLGSINHFAEYSARFNSYTLLKVN